MGVRESRALDGVPQETCRHLSSHASPSSLCWAGSVRSSWVSLGRAMQRPLGSSVRRLGILLI